MVLTCYRRNCLHWKNATSGTLMPGKRCAASPLCRHCLCHCRYVILHHLVASMHSFIAHYHQSLAVRSSLHPWSSSPNCPDLPVSLVWRCSIRPLQHADCLYKHAVHMSTVMMTVDIVMLPVPLDAVIRVLLPFSVYRAALSRYFGIAVYLIWMLRPTAMHDSDILYDSVCGVCVSFTIAVVRLTLHGNVVNNRAAFVNEPKRIVFILVLPFVIIVTRLVDVFCIIYISVYTNKHHVANWPMRRNHAVDRAWQSCDKLQWSAVWARRYYILVDQRRCTLSRSEPPPFLS